LDSPSTLGITGDGLDECLAGLGGKLPSILLTTTKPS
jgi:hypothetical protein